MGGHGKKRREAEARRTPMYDELETLARAGKWEEFARECCSRFDPKPPTEIIDGYRVWADREAREKHAMMRLEEGARWLVPVLLSKLDAAKREIEQLRKSNAPEENG